LTGQTSSNLTRSLDVSSAGYTPVLVEDVEFAPATSKYYHSTSGPFSFYPDVYYRDPSNPTKRYQAYYNCKSSNSEESASSMNISSNMITYTSQGAKKNTRKVYKGQFGDSSSDIVDGYIISDPTYEYGKRVVSVTYRKNS
jgi:hypothetical protein